MKVSVKFYKCIGKYQCEGSFELCFELLSNAFKKEKWAVLNKYSVNDDKNLTAFEISRLQKMSIDKMTTSKEIIKLKAQITS